MITLVFGDSIAWGAFDEIDGGWVERLKKDSFKKEDFVYNCSISGDTSSAILSRIYNEISSRRDPEDDLRVIFAFGANDAGRVKNRLCVPIHDFSLNVHLLTKGIKSIVDEIYFVGLTPVDHKRTIPVAWDKKLCYHNEDITIYNNKLKEIVESAGGKFINVIDTIQKIHLRDGIHPNAAGHKLLYKAIKKNLIKK